MLRRLCSIGANTARTELVCVPLAQTKRLPTLMHAFTGYSGNLVKSKGYLRFMRALTDVLLMGLVSDPDLSLPMATQRHDERR